MVFNSFFPLPQRETKKSVITDLIETEENRLMTTQASMVQSHISIRRASTKGISQISMRTSMRNSDMLPWQIAQLKYKCMILVNSLWESQQTPKRIGRLMRSIPLDVLKQNIAEVYKQYKELYATNYTAKAFGHV